MPALFYACAVAEEAAAYRWRRLAPAHQAALRACLWQCATEPAPGGGSRPHFVRSKAAAALAHLACLDWPAAWPEFWPALQACLADPARVEAGVDLLGTTVDHFHSLTQTTSAGLKGKVGAGT